jgi:hypothetical protein
MEFNLDKTLIINQQALVNYCAFTQLLEARAIEPYIFTIQHQYVKYLLCPDFYSNLIEQIQSNTISYENEILINGTSDFKYLGLVPYLAWASYREYIIKGNVRSTQSGLNIYTSDTTERPSDKQLDLLVTDANNKVNFYRAEVVVFLEANKSDYPLWDCDCIDKKGNNNTNITPIQDSKYDFFNTRIGVMKSHRR